MAISSLGAGSGLDLSGILTNLMQVEQQPLVALQSKEASYLSRISALGTLKSSLSSLQTAAQSLIPSSGQTASEKYTTLKVSTADSTIATATISAGAIATSYTLTDITLASNQQLRKSGLVPPASGSDGTLHIKVGTGTAVDVAVTGGSTLSQVASAINLAKTGITASVINDGTNDHLTISSNSTGDGNNIEITTSSTGWEGFAFSGGALPDNGWNILQDAKSASAKINGLPVTSQTNTLSSAISNVSITLLKESASGTSLTVSKDTSSSIYSGVNSFIKAYNDAVTSMGSLGYYDSSSKSAGALQGDSVLRGSQNLVRGLLQTTAGGSSDYQTLSDIGVEMQKDGTLKLNSSKLSTATSADYDGVVELVTKIGTAFKTSLDGVVGTSGTLASATDSTNRLIKQVNQQQTRLSDRLTQIEARYRKQFSSLDTLIAGMKQTSSWLTQQLANLPGSISSSNNK